MTLTVENVLDETFEIAEDDIYTPEVYTVREFFTKLAIALWDDPEGFIGKRPFGDSGWKEGILYDLAERHGVTEEAVEALIMEALRTNK